MHSSKKQARISARVFSQKSQAHAPSIRRDQSDGSLVVTIGDTDLPSFVSSGILYIQAPLSHVFRAFAEDLSDFIRDMEVRVSGPRGASLSLDSDGRPVYRAGVDLEDLVSDRREW